jgi:hypothetical protein
MTSRQSKGNRIGAHGSPHGIVRKDIRQAALSETRASLAWFNQSGARNHESRPQFCDIPRNDRPIPMADRPRSPP